MKQKIINNNNIIVIIIIIINNCNEKETFTWPLQGVKENQQCVHAPIKPCSESSVSSRLFHSERSRSVYRSWFAEDDVRLVVHQCGQKECTSR